MIFDHFLGYSNWMRIASYMNNVLCDFDLCGWFFTKGINGGSLSPNQNTNFFKRNSHCDGTGAIHEVIFTFRKTSWLDLKKQALWPKTKVLKESHCLWINSLVVKSVKTNFQGGFFMLRIFFWWRILKPNYSKKPYHLR